MQEHLSDRQLRERVIKLVQDACHMWPKNPTIADIESKFMLKVREGILPIDKDGVYVEQDAKIIINNRITSRERRQFTLYHELIHHLIRLDDDLYSYLHDAYSDSDNFDRTLEIICNIGAAELILPREEVRNLIEEKGFSLGLLPELCNSNPVSGPAALIQLVECAPNKCYGIVCENGPLSSSIGSDQLAFVDRQHTDALYIIYATWSPTVQYPVARFTRIAKDHLLSTALSSQDIIKGHARIPFRSSTNWQVPCEVCSFRSNIYGLFHVTAAPSAQQPRLF